jgi:TolB-like protein
VQGLSRDLEVKYVLEGSAQTEHGSTGWMIKIASRSDGYGR